jgi:hypothetical protein
MSPEVYLLSIPLARHRTIVPRHRGTRNFFEEAAVHAPEQRIRGLSDGIVEPATTSSARQRLDRD